MTTDKDEHRAKVAQRWKALRVAIGGLTQDEAADRAGLAREYVNKIENAHNLGSTERVRGAMAKAYGVTRDDLADYIDERIELDQILARRLAGATVSGKSDQPLLGSHPQWPALVAAARALRPRLSLAAFERIAPLPYLWGPLDQITPTLLADLARDVQDHLDQQEGAEPPAPPSRRPH